MLLRLQLLLGLGCCYVTATGKAMNCTIYFNRHTHNLNSNWAQNMAIDLQYTTVNTFDYLPKDL